MQSWTGNIGEATAAWRGPVLWGFSAVLLLWVVWYFTKAPCTMENAREGLCNAGALARFINYQILAQCILLGLAVAAVKGGYNEIMVSRERKRADEAEARLEETRKRVDALYEEFFEQQRAEREVDRAERQAVLNTLAQINNTLTQLLARQNNGRSSPEDR